MADGASTESFSGLAARTRRRDTRPGGTAREPSRSDHPLDLSSDSPVPPRPTAGRSRGGPGSVISGRCGLEQGPRGGAETLDQGAQVLLRLPGGCRQILVRRPVPPCHRGHATGSAATRPNARAGPDPGGGGRLTLDGFEAANQAGRVTGAGSQSRAAVRHLGAGARPARTAAPRGWRPHPGDCRRGPAGRSWRRPSRSEGRSGHGRRPAQWYRWPGAPMGLVAVHDGVILVPEKLSQHIGQGRALDREMLHPLVRIRPAHAEARRGAERRQNRRRPGPPDPPPTPGWARSTGAGAGAASSAAAPASIARSAASASPAGAKRRPVFRRQVTVSRPRVIGCAPARSSHGPPRLCTGPASARRALLHPQRPPR